MPKKLIVKKNLKKAWNEFVYSGHLISLGAACIVSTSAIMLGIKSTWQVLIISYLTTFVGLLYNRYKEQGTDSITNPQRTIYLKKYFHFIFPIITSSVLFCIIVLLFYQKIATLIFIILLCLLCFVYTKYLKRMTSKIAALKNIIFSLITSSLVVFLAIYNSYPLLSFSLFLMWFFVFLRMVVNTIFLDIKDVESDKKQSLLTIPILIGREKTLTFLRWMTVFSVVPIIFGVLLGDLPKFSLVLLFVIPYSFYYFEKSKKKKNFYLTNYILADSEFILWLVFILLGEVLL